MRDIKFAQSARKHRIGRAHVLYVIETVPYTRYPATGDLDARIEWVGLDDRDVELEVIAVLNTAPLTRGTHTLTAVFTPTNPIAYGPSTSPPVPLTVPPLF